MIQARNPKAQTPKLRLGFEVKELGEDLRRHLWLIGFQHSDCRAAQLQKPLNGAGTLN